MHLSPRKFLKEDYDIISQWWKTYGWTPPQLKSLPDNGILIEFEGNPIVCGFIYLGDGSFSFIEWVIADKSSDSQARKIAVDMLIKELIQIAKNNKREFIYTCTPNPSLIKAYEHNGMTVLEKSTTTLGLSFSTEDLDFMKE